MVKEGIFFIKCFPLVSRNNIICSAQVWHKSESWWTLQLQVCLVADIYEVG